MSTTANTSSRERAPSIGRRLLGAAILVVVASAALAAGCGGSDGDATAFTPVAGTESAYCDNYRGWQVFKLNRGDENQPNPAALEAWWNDYVIFNETSLKQAPQQIRDEWRVNISAMRTLLTPLLEKYDFDMQRMMSDGTPAEKALSEPPANVKKAQAEILAYEATVCGVDGPPAANVVFKAGASSEPYCAALGTVNGELGKIESSRFDPDVMRTYLTSDRFMGQLDALDETAPAEIAADVKAETEWFRTRWSDVIAEFDYDIRRIWLDGTPEDRAVFTLSHPDIVEHASRDTAYEEQVCTG